MGIPLDTDRGAFIIGCIVCAQRIRGRLRQEVMEDWFLTSGWCHWSVLTSDCGIWISSTSYSGFDLSLVRLIAWTEDTYIGLTLRLFLVSTTLLDTVYCEAHSLQVMRTQLETRGEEFKLAGNIWWREPIMLWTWTLRCIGIVRTMIIFGHLICLRVLWWDVSVLWGQYLHHRHRGLWIMHLILWCAFYRSWDDFGYLYEDDIVLVRLWSTLWIGYYSGRKTSAIQLYLADLHWQCRIEHSILHWAWKLWDAISIWKTDLEKELCVLTMFCIQKKVVQTPCVNHFVLEKLVTSLTNELVIHVWMRTSLIWELLEVFRWFLNSSSEIEFCRRVAAGIVSTNLYLKNLRFVNWKPEIEFTSWDIGSKDWCQKFI